MSLVMFGTGITEITGSLGGIYFHRDKSGNHCNPQPRHVSKRTTAQTAQRNAFSKARHFCSEPMCISTNIYRALNNLELHHYNKNREQVPTH